MLGNERDESKIPWPKQDLVDVELGSKMLPLQCGSLGMLKCPLCLPFLKQVNPV